MKYLVIVAIAGTVALFAGSYIYEEIKIRRLAKKLDDAEKAAEAQELQQEANNEAKEQMETGNAAADFNASINLLHNLKRSNKK